MLLPQPEVRQVLVIHGLLRLDDSSVLHITVFQGSNVSTNVPRWNASPVSSMEGLQSAPLLFHIYYSVIVLQPDIFPHIL